MHTTAGKFSEINFKRHYSAFFFFLSLPEARAHFRICPLLWRWFHLSTRACNELYRVKVVSTIRIECYTIAEKKKKKLPTNNTSDFIACVISFWHIRAYTYVITRLLTWLFTLFYTSFAITWVIIIVSCLITVQCSRIVCTRVTRQLAFEKGENCRWGCCTRKI